MGGGGTSCCVSGIVIALSQLSGSQVAVDADCSIYYYHNNGLTKSMSKVTKDGTKTTFSTETQLDTLSAGPAGLLINAAGDFFVTTSDGIAKLDATGAPSMVYSDGATLGFNHPDHFSMDSTGNFYVSNFMGGDQKVFKITAGGAGSVVVTPSDPTGIGSNALLANGDLVYFGNSKLMRVPAGTSTEELYLADYETKILDLEVAEGGAIETGAINVKKYFGNHSFAIDENENIYTIATVEYLIDDGGWKEKKRSRLVKITPSGTLSTVFPLTPGLDPTDLVYRNNTLFFYNFNNSAPTNKHELRCYGL